MLEYQTTVGTGSELRCVVGLNLVAVSLVSQGKFLVPRTVGKKVNKEFAFLISTEVAVASFP